MAEPTKLLDGGTFFEAPRWHEGCWWVSDFYTDGGRIVAVEPGGAIARSISLDQPSGLGWLPDGDLLAVSMSTHKIWRIADGAEPEVYADLTDHSRGESNDMTVDAEGRVWVDAFGYDLYAGERPVGSPLMRVDPDGTVTPVADGLHFPNSIIVPPPGDTLIVAETIASRLTAYDIRADGTLANRRVYCQVAPTVPLEEIADDYSNVAYGPDGCTLDAAGCVWAGNSLGDWIGRFSPGGEVLQRIDAPEAGMATYAVQLGGADGRTLLMCVAPDWRLGMGGDEPRASLWTVEVDVPHHGGTP
ncbi:MAG TPA: SMP-30/gluconolactonase/LRE family protein [Solirubrobacterales bacterium]|jgi:sugar lactone lactonase YvrE|nr:SMP-30/gluconolactonase/LRE family protein [Solirubrobacterales bacterium]